MTVFECGLLSKIGAIVTVKPLLPQSPFDCCSLVSFSTNVPGAENACTSGCPKGDIFVDVDVVGTPISVSVS